MTVSIPGAVVYLLLVLIEALGAGAPVRADYLQDGEPVARLVATPVEGAPGGYRIVADASDEDAPVVVDIERGSLTGHHFLVAMPGEPLPSVVSLGPVYRQLVGVTDTAVLTLLFSGDDALASGDLDAHPGSKVYLLRYGDLTLLSAPEPGILLVIVEG